MLLITEEITSMSSESLSVVTYRVTAFISTTSAQVSVFKPGSGPAKVQASFKVVLQLKPDLQLRSKLLSFIIVSLKSWGNYTLAIL